MGSLHQKVLKLWIVGSLCFVQGACSLGALFSDPKPSTESDVPNYQDTKTGCSNLDLSKPQLDVKGFRSLLKCANSGGALQSLMGLLDGLSDDQAEPLVDFVNRTFLSDSKLLHQIERTFYDLKETGRLEQLLQAIGKYLENPRLVQSIVGLWQDLHSTQGFFSRTVQINPDVLLFFKGFGEKISPKNTERLLDISLNLLDSQVYPEITERLRPVENRFYPLELVLKGLVEYFRENAERKRDLIRVLLEEVASGAILDVMDEVLGTAPETFKVEIPRLSSVLQVHSTPGFLQTPTIILDEISSLFHFGNARIDCLSGAKIVPNGTKKVIKEFLNEPTVESAKEYIKRGKALEMVATQAACDYSSGIFKYQDGIYKIAKTSAFDPMYRSLKILTSHPQQYDLVLELLGDIGPEEKSGIKNLIPLVTELNQRNLWNPLLLLLQVPQGEDRRWISSAVQEALLPRASLGNQSLYDLAIRVLSKLSVRKLTFFFEAVQEALRAESLPSLPKLIGVLREAYHTNAAHPFLNTMRRVFVEAPEKPKLFETLFVISESNDLANVIRDLSSVSKDGRLASILERTLGLVHHFAEKARDLTLVRQQVPIFIPKRRHNLRVKDLIPYPLTVEAEDPFEPCRKIDLTLGIDQDDRPGYAENLTQVLNCINTVSDREDLKQLVQYFKDRRDPDKNHNFLALPVNFFRDLRKRFSEEENNHLVDGFFKILQDRRVFRALDSLPFWIEPQRSGDMTSSVARSFLDLSFPLLQSREELRSLLQTVGKQALLHPDFLSLVRYLRDFSDQKPEPVPLPDLKQIDTERMMRWVHNKECQRNGSDSRRNREEEFARTIEIISDYQDGVTNWDIVNDQARRFWEDEEIRPRINEVLGKIADPKQSHPNKSINRALWRVLSYFTLESGEAPSRDRHFTPEYFMEWFRKQTQDIHLITYFYPDEKAPRVRLINSLDRLELILINADADTSDIPQFVLDIMGLPRHLGLHFLAEIGKAWGDEPKDLWPEEIVKMAEKTGKPPMKLQEAVKDIEEMEKWLADWMGFPAHERCHQVAPPRPDPDDLGHLSGNGRLGLFVPEKIKVSIYNSLQVGSYLKEMLPGSGGRFDGDLKVLRNLFFELYSSTPEGSRSDSSGMKNNLMLIIKLVQLGLGRQVGRHLRAYEEPSPELNDFSRGFIRGAQSPQIFRLLNLLLGQPAGHNLTWTILNQLFDLLDAPVVSQDLLEPERRAVLANQSDADQLLTRAKWSQEVARFKQLSFYLIASLGWMSRNGDQHPRVLPEKVLRVVAEAFEKHHSYLTRHPLFFGKMFKSDTLSYGLRSLYEDTQVAQKKKLSAFLTNLLQNPFTFSEALSVADRIDQHPQASASWNRLDDQIQAVLDHPDFQRLHIGDLADELIDYLLSEEEPQQSVSRKVREFVAEVLVADPREAVSPVERLLGLVAGRYDPDSLCFLRQTCGPERFYGTLRTLSTYIQNGELEKFLQKLERSVADP